VSTSREIQKEAKVEVLKTAKAEEPRVVGLRGDTCHQIASSRESYIGVSI
jgi:hypothetical protein